MSYSINDIKTKALVYNTLEQNLTTSVSGEFLKLCSFDKSLEKNYNAIIDLILDSVLDDGTNQVIKLSVKISNNYYEFFDVVNDTQTSIELYKNTTEDGQTDEYIIVFSNGIASGTNIKCNTSVRRGIMNLNPIEVVAEKVGDLVLSINKGYARALPDNYLTSVSGLSVSIENNDLIIS